MHGYILFAFKKILFSDYKQTTPNYVVLYQRIVWRQWYQDLQECEKYSEENAVQCVQ